MILSSVSSLVTLHEGDSWRKIGFPQTIEGSLTLHYNVRGPPPPWGIRQGVMAKPVLIPSPSIGKLKPTGISIPLDGVDVLALPLFAAKAQVPRENNSSVTRIRVRIWSPGRIGRRRRIARGRTTHHLGRFCRSERSPGNLVVTFC